jgi:hypothetical protein
MIDVYQAGAGSSERPISSKSRRNLQKYSQNA